MKKILLLSTGGTIAATPSDQGGLIPTFSGQDLVDLVPELREMDVALTARSLMSVDSSNLTPRDWVCIARAAFTALPDHDGLVVTHGTDTMTYTAAALSFMLPGLNKPLVLTGSQLPITHPKSDGRRNLRHAVLAAASPRLPGVSIVFNHKVILGCRANKLHSRRLDAFVSRNYPYLGRIRRDELVILRERPRPETPPHLSDRLVEDVFLLKLTPGTKPSIKDFLISRHYRGLIIESFGVGGIPHLQDNILGMIEELTRRRMPVVLVTQCLYDGARLDVYEVGVRAERAGAISGHDLTTEAAFAKLMWVLGQTDSLDRAAALMQTNLAGEISVDENKTSNPYIV